MDDFDKSLTEIARMLSTGKVTPDEVRQRAALLLAMARVVEGKRAMS